MAEDDQLAIGVRVEVRVRYDGTWSRGFEVTEINDDGYRLRRTVDGSELPGRFHTDEVRQEISSTSW